MFFPSPYESLGYEPAPKSRKKQGALASRLEQDIISLGLLSLIVLGRSKAANLL